VHNDAVSNVEHHSAFEDLSPPPSSFGGFSATPVVGFFWPLRMRVSRLAGLLSNKITPSPPPVGNVHETLSAKAHETRNDWFVVDAADKILGWPRPAPPARRDAGAYSHVDTGDTSSSAIPRRFASLGAKPKARNTTATAAIRGSAETSFGRCRPDSDARSNWP
jgi:hypothetical protein